MNVGNWLRSLGLGEYEAAFRENAIDETILASLTADDLKDLGVGIVGHRRKLLNAIAALNADANAKPTASDNLPIDRAVIDAAERRHITVMFCDLVGSTAMSARMDPEDLREVISAYQKSVTNTVSRFNGFVAKYMGDGVLVYFGYPEAHEDDPEQAVRAGLALISAVAALTSPVSLQTRVGIATGLVVIGDLIGSGQAQERGIVGETPNLAARLQGIAEPNMVVIAESTRRLVGNLFEFEDLGPQDLKGIAGPARAWSALRANPVESRFDALRAGGTTLVGREEEIELLMRRWAKAKSNDGQVVLLSGEAGIGKSRLTAAIMERLADEQHARLRYFCSPQHTVSTLYPIIGQMERTAGLAHGDVQQAKLNKLDALLAQTSTPIEDASLLADMLMLGNDERYPAVELNPQQRRQRTLDALMTQVERRARQSPVLMIFEDVHWIDPTSLELLGRMVERIEFLRALLIVTFRPEFQPTWIGRPHVTALTVNRLTQRDVNAMIERVVANKLLPAVLVTEIIERTDGIPLFVEEMTKAMLEANSEDQAQQTAAAVPFSALAVPASLHASLMARLDRLGPAKEVAQIGATIGREFSYALLAAVMRRPDAELVSALDRLTEAGLLFQQGEPPYATYLFKHALVQDAAYGTLLREPRRTLHAWIAEALESRFEGVADRQPELLARHWTEAGQKGNAAALWSKAGQRSLERSALAEAAEQFSRALDQIAGLPATPALRREQVKLQVALLTPLMHLKGYAAPETKEAAERARLLIEQAEARGEPPEDPLLLFSALYGIWVANFVAFDGDAMIELAAQFLKLAKKQGTTIPLMIGYRITGISQLFTGDITAGRMHLDRAIALYDPLEHRPLALRFGQDIGVGILSWRPLALWLHGYPDAALAAIEHAIKDAREIGQAATLMLALANTLSTHVYCGSFPALTTQAEELVALADEKSAALWKAFGAVSRGCLFALTGEPTRAVQMIASGIAAFQSSGSTFFLPGNLSLLARAYAELGKFEEAWNCIGEAMKAAETTGECWSEAEIHRTAGEMTLMMPEPDAAKAEVYFERALAIARVQKARSWELRAATSMARLWRDQGKRRSASDLLTPIYGWFTEGFDTLDLKQAKALLGELAS